MAHYDLIVIGGGLAGLAAAIRAAHFAPSVRIFEQHTVVGGLNSWYRRDGRVIDVGLHALTNYVPEDDRNAPLNRVLRQLRIKRDRLDLVPQGHSEIVFPGNTLRLENDFGAFRRQIHAQFPDDAAGFDALVEAIRREAYSGDARPYRSTRWRLRQYIKSRRLRDMLCMPVMYYGNPRPVDMDFQAFCTIFQSIFIEGFARPRHGMRPFLELLSGRLQEEGGVLSTGCGIVKIHHDGRRITGVVDAKGQCHDADNYIAAIGSEALLSLLDCPGGLSRHLPLVRKAGNHGNRPLNSFVEGVFRLPKPVSDYGLAAAITFLCDEDEFVFDAPLGGNAPCGSMLICAPGNYPGCEEDSGILRLSAMTSCQAWSPYDLTAEEYISRKQSYARHLLELLGTRHPRLAADARMADLFTPRTICRYTRQSMGGIYGGTMKLKDFRTGFKNMLIAGTDQGLLGIVGSMLSGVIAANMALARKGGA